MIKAVVDNGFTFSEYAMLVSMGLDAGIMMLAHPRADICLLQDS